MPQFCQETQVSRTAVRTFPVFLLVRVYIRTLQQTSMITGQFAQKNEKIQLKKPNLTTLT